MLRLRGYGWLVLGAVLAVLVPVLGLGEATSRALRRVLPLPWDALGIGLLLFWAAAGLYFRSHWVATLRALRNIERRAGDAARRLDSVIADGERWGYVLRDNLLEAGRDDVPDDQARMYLEGATAHAGKVLELVERCRRARACLAGETSVDGEPE